MKNLINKVKNMKKEELNFLIVYLLLSIFGMIYIAQKSVHLGLKFTCLMEFIGLITWIVLYYIIRKWINNKVPLHKIYLLVAIVFGVFYIGGFPPSQLPDDINDYSRSLEVANLHQTSVKRGDSAGRSFSDNITDIYDSENYGDVIDDSDKKLVGKKKFFLFANKSLYHFVCYIPQAIGVGIGSILGLPILFQIILGKMCNYALFVLLVYLSIKYIPTKKFLIFFTALLPISMQEAASLSPDAMTIATSIALVSFILWSRNTDKVFTKKHYFALISLSIALSLCKIVYLPLCLLVFLIPKERFGNLKKKKIILILLTISVIILNLIWLKFSSRYLTAFYGRSNSGEQLKYILSNPIRYVLILFTTLDVYIWTYLEQMVGHSLGKFVVGTSYIMSILAIYNLVQITKETDKKEKPEFNLLEKLFIGLMILGTLGLTFTSLYLQWTAVGAPVVDGIQGRYFIPLFLPIATFFMTKKENVSSKDNLLAFSLIQNILAIVAIITTFI